MSLRAAPVPIGAAKQSYSFYRLLRPRNLPRVLAKGSLAMTVTLIFGLLSSLFARSPYYYFNQNKFDDVVAELKRPQWLAAYNQVNFQYASDYQEFAKFEYWQHPREFFQRKKGDCEDYAFWNDYVLQSHGYDSMVVAVGEPVLDHALVIFSEQGEKKYLDFYQILDIGAHPYSLPIEQVDSKNYNFYATQQYPDRGSKHSTFSSVFEQRLQVLDHPSTINLTGKNYFELYLPLVNYTYLKNKEACAYGRKLASDVAVFFSFAAFGWYSPNPKFNEHLYGTTFSYRWMAVTGYLGDYQGVDLDFTLPVSKFFNLTTAYRSGNIWDWQVNFSTNLFDFRFRYDDGKIFNGEFLFKGIIVSNQYIGLSNQFIATYYNFLSQSLTFKMQF